MTYLEALDSIREIESKNPVMSIKSNGVSVWPYLRLYLLDHLSGRCEIKVNGSIIKQLLRSLFYYNPLLFLKKHSAWVFSDTERRKLIGGIMELRVSGVISKCIKDVLIIEKPNTHINHYPKKKILEKEIISESWLFLLIKFFLLIQLKNKIENESLLRKIIENTGGSFDYNRYIKQLIAQRKSMSLLLRIASKPNIVFMEAPCNKMGYMWAFHKKGIPVIEMQHGVINKYHIAYNGLDYEAQMNPDAICVYGDLEIKYFNEEQKKYASKVFGIGSYILERADDWFNTDPYREYRKEFGTIVSVSGQYGFESILADYLVTLAQSHPNVLFLYYPRYKDNTTSFSNHNIITVDNNIYECLKWCDIHLTLYSTTCLEAHFFHKSVILYDYGGLGSRFYGENFGVENGFFYSNSPEEFDQIVDEIKKKKNFVYKNAFYKDVKRNVQNVIANMTIVDQEIS